jgi:hypothetical protein
MGMPTQSRRRARPATILGALDQAGAHGVALDVAEHGQKVIVLLDGKGAEAALVDVAAAMIMAVIAADVSGKQPHHVVAQVAVGARPEGKVKMVGHQAISQESHRRAFAGPAEQFEKSGLVAVLAKDAAAAIASIEDMVAVAAQSSA